MDTNMFIAGAAGFAPAILLIYYTLKDYTYPAVEKPFFDDRKAFGLFAIGLVIGTLIYAIQSWFSIELLLFALLFAVLEELLKLIILNLPRFQGKLDTAFYGATLGLGIGATMGFGAVYITMGQIGDLQPLSWVLLITIAVQFVLLHGGTGATIGIGVARKMPWPYFAQATLVHLAYNILMIPFFTGDELLGYPLFALATAILVVFYYQVWRKVLPELVRARVSKLEKMAKG
jgi:hypothetical protein